MVSKEYEEFFIIIICLISAFALYKLFTMIWNNSKVEGLETMKNSTLPTGLAVNSTATLATLTTTNEAIRNEVLLTNPVYNQNYSDMCGELYNIVNLKMINTVANLNPTSPSFMRGLTDLNTLYQSKIALNDTLKTIDNTEITETDKK